MPGNKLPCEIVFITGAPRSGTTIAHALVCTSASVNDYIAECSYFSQLVRAFDRGMETFDIHTRYYFDSQPDYANLHRGLLATVLTDHWQQLGRPSILVLKDPDMLPIVPTVAALVEHARFVVLYRDPLDVISSRVQVQNRRNPSGNFLTPDNLTSLAEEYVTGYTAIDQIVTLQPSRFLLLEYEELVRADTRALQNFLNADDIETSSVWRKSRVAQASVAEDAWNSLLYFKPVSAAAIGSYRQLLNAEAIHLIERLCGPTLERLHQLSHRGTRR